VAVKGVVGRFAHPALLYRGDAEYLVGTVPYIRAGLAAGEPVAVAVPGENLRLIRDALGADAGRVLFRDMAIAGRNPGRIIPTVLLAFADAHPGRRVRLIGEPIWAGRSATEYPACAQHEALINAVFADRAATILCPYNTELLDPVWVADAHQTHPVLVDTAGRYDSPRYHDPIAVAAGFNLPLTDPPAGAATSTVDIHTLPAARHFITEYATRAGLASARVGDLVLAVNELATNAAEHGGGSGQLSVWTQGDHLVCQLADRGQFSNPLAGRIPVPADVPGGRGLLLVNQLCDLVRMHTTPTGTIIRIHVLR
jgi:anti-sigma regulatory factor (Ser/Thr protein kinase)